MHRPSLTVYLPNLASGGAERLHINLAPALVARGYDVTILVNRAVGALVSAVPPQVRLISLGRSRSLYAFLPLVRYLRREKPDVLLANLGHSNITAILAALCARVPTRVIVTQHNALSREARQNWRFGLLPWLYRLLLPGADGIVAVSKGVGEDMARVTGVDPARISVIYNPVVTSDFDRNMQAHADHPWLSDEGPPFILAVGRMMAQKGFDTLLAAFSLASQSRPLRLLILGEGPLQQQLMRKAALWGVSDRVSMPGFQLNTLAFMRKAAMLVMSSRYEGFGNVLVEALACGVNVVSTDCPYGPSEILDNGRFGMLVPVDDAQAIARAILATLASPLAPEILRARGRTFSVERAAAEYIRLFRSAGAMDAEIAVTSSAA